VLGLTPLSKTVWAG